MSNNNKPSKLNLRLVLTVLLVVILAWLILSGRLTLFGGNAENPTAAASVSTDSGIPLVTGSGTADSGLPLVTEGSAAESRTAEAQTSAAEPAQATAKADTSAPAAQTSLTSARQTHVALKDYYFRNKSLLNSHYDKHGREMGFKSAKEYEAAASAVINDPAALYKIEKEDGDHVFYIEKTNEFVVLSKDGYIRTYFKPDGGKRYFDRQ